MQLTGWQQYGYLLLLPDADIKHVSATLPKHSLETAHRAKAWCRFPLLKLEGGTHSVEVVIMNGPVIGGAATVGTTLAFDLQHGLNCRVLSPSVSSKPVATL